MVRPLEAEEGVPFLVVQAVRPLAVVVANPFLVEQVGHP